MSQQPKNTASSIRAQYWLRTRRLTLQLLCVWFFVTFGVAWFARPLSNLTLFGWQLSYYMAAQGTILIYVMLVGFYAWRMSKLDKMLDAEKAEDANGK
jgi:putative solute:sodium symporter small subunit